jgi:hypothetical protein
MLPGCIKAKTLLNNFPHIYAHGYEMKARNTAVSRLAQVFTALSELTKDTRWFSGRTPNPAFPNPTTFMGDYSGIATAQFGIAALWTDMRENACFGTRCGAGQDTYYGSTP